MMQTIPLQPVPNQSLSLVLGERNVALTVRTLGGRTYIDVTCEGIPLCRGLLCQDRVLLSARAAYLGFPELGLFFADLRGTAAPDWREFGTRFLLLNYQADPAPTIDTLGPKPKPPLRELLANGRFIANGTQFATGVITDG